MPHTWCFTLSKTQKKVLAWEQELNIFENCWWCMPWITCSASKLLLSKLWCLQRVWRYYIINYIKYWHWESTNVLHIVPLMSAVGLSEVTWNPHSWVQHMKGCLMLPRHKYFNCQDKRPTTKNQVSIEGKVLANSTQTSQNYLSFMEGARDATISLPKWRHLIWDVWFFHLVEPFPGQWLVWFDLKCLCRLRSESYDFRGTGFQNGSNSTYLEVFINAVVGTFTT